MSKLRDYVVKFGSHAPFDAIGFEKSLAVDGNFFFVKSVRRVNFDTDYSANVDYYVKISFDDKSSIIRRAGEGGSRNYSRITITVYYDEYGLNPVDSDDLMEINIVLGEGSLYSERVNGAVPTTLFTAQFSVGAGSTVEITPSDITAGIIGSPLETTATEMRFCIPSTEANGLFFSQDAAIVGAWLEKGVTEWLTFDGKIVFKNNGGSAVLLTAAIFNKKP